MKYFTYSCGCKFPISEDNGITKIDFEPTIENLNLDCQRTWDLISEGNTKGVFQLESRLGKQTAKKTQTRKSRTTFCLNCDPKTRLP